MRNISQEKIGAVVLPVPTLEEQVVIVAEVAENLSQIEAAEAAIQHGLRRAARLRQSILKRAFEGKLVPQDPNDEPAERMLERVRMDRERSESADKAGFSRRARRVIVKRKGDQQ